ncbi:MAG TPA: CrcB family protein [Bryobacteraceae bacterium]
MVGGGRAGSLTRYLLGRAIVQRFPNANFAAGTFAINVAGSFLIGLLMGCWWSASASPLFGS